MKIFPLILPPPLSQQMEQEAVRAYPQECCGILLGREFSETRIVEMFHPAENVFDSGERHHRFSIDPRLVMQIDKESAARGQEIIGFYHSHPDQPARPSEYDRQSAWPVYSYLIISILKGEAVDITSWVLDDRAAIFHRQDIIEDEVCDGYRTNS